MDSATLTLITQGFADLKDTFTQVLAIAIPVIVGIITLGAGANFALRKLRGVLSWG